MGDNANSLVFDTKNARHKQDQDVLSAEDLAWADSCLVENPEMSDTNLDSIKDALLDILGQFSPSANEQTDSNDIRAPENFALEETSDTAETNADEHPENERHDVLFSLKKPFLPNYNDEMMNTHYSDSDSDSDFVFSEIVMDPPSGDIFKVWDLDIPVEEDELVKELKEALSESSSKVPKTAKGSKAESLDDLVESVAGLSLK